MPPLANSEQPITRYLCQRCANCCKWPGDVIVTEDEVGKIAAFVGLPVDDFIQRFTRLSANRQHLSLIEKENGECHFLNSIDCTINEVKPAQCAGFPNQWRFPGWRDVCEAIPLEPRMGTDGH